MTKLNQIYKCAVCGNIVEVLHGGSDSLVCCDIPMILLEEKTTDPEISVEKHVPVIENDHQGIKVKIGEIPHPMTEEHHIEFIEVLTEDGKVGRKYLAPGDVPEAEFYTKSKILEVREYCNLHGLWKNVTQ